MTGQRAGAGEACSLGGGKWRSQAAPACCGQSMVN